MFRIAEILVDDNKLPKLLWALSVIGVQIPNTPQPVVNAKRHKNGVLAAETSGRLSDMYREHIRKHKLTQVTPADVKAFCESVGRSAKSYSVVIQELRSEGLLKSNGKSTFGRVYHVVGAKPAKKTAKK